MTNVEDGYDTYYSERLWQSLPGIYRAEDTDSLDTSGSLASGGLDTPGNLNTPGPLREIINRIGGQLAVVRRSIDRLWADQSIETCDDWVVPYIGDLLGTNLVNHLDAQGQRRDVAKTMHYRRRKGTLDVLEELALDVTGWTARVAESFRRLARTRHSLDPAVGPEGFPHASAAEVAELLLTEGLAGPLTRGLAGGFADLRSRHGTALAGTAFDESFHAVDVRAGRGALGHFAASRLLVFLWRLASFPIVGGTPVPIAGSPGQYVFDPTGRQIPLFLPPAPDLGDESPVMPREWQVPGPLTSSLETAITDAGTSPPLPARPPYPDTDIPPRYALGGDWQFVSIWPEAGRFAATPPSPVEPLTVSYNYGFSSMIGAGPYDRGLFPDPPGVVGAETRPLTRGDGLATALAELGPTGTVTLGDPRAPDSATYTTLPDADSSTEPIDSVLVRAGPQMRPVVRPAADGTSWVFTGRGDAELVIDGLTVSGCDIVLRGSFNTVRLTACTVDPGTAGDPDAAGPGSAPLAVAVDGRPLAPCRIFVEAGPETPPGERGAIRRLLVDHCILGPVRTRFGGAVETLKITDSIVQGLPATAGPDFTEADVFDPSLLAVSLLSADPLAAALLEAMPASAVRALRAYRSRGLNRQRAGLSRAALGGLNELVNGPSLYNRDRFARRHLSPALLRELGGRGRRDPDGVAWLNRRLLEEVFPVALGVAALAVADATVELTRVTVLGRVACQRLRTDDSIITDFAVADDVQDGCVRFSAYADGSVLPQRHASAVIPPGAPIFTSDSYGQPGYAQLLETADTAIAGGAVGVSISTGAETGSEMGAFSADLNPVKEQGLLVKYAEYMPLGLMPVIVHVT